MTEKEMKKLRRADLLEMLLGQMEENRKLKKKIKQMEKELSDRSIAVEESGSIAEAALRLNRVFEAAQQAQISISRIFRRGIPESTKI